MVGEESAGKSSVLGGITDLPFKTSATACTRGATEIQLRDGPPSRRAWIVPDPDRDEASKRRLREFERTWDADEDFADIFAEANAAMGVNRSGFVIRDKLVMRQTRPGLPLLTLTDLPGLVNRANTTQSQKDIDDIEAMTDSHIRDPNTIILAVVGGHGNYVQARVLNKVKEFDPTGSRTIGVVTKPDLISRNRLTETFINLVTNNDVENQMRLGWYVVLNPEPGQVWPPGEESRATIERDFFSREEWRELPHHQRGTRVLTEQLSRQLMSRLLASIPKLESAVEQDLEKTRRERLSLGEARKDAGPETRRAELVGYFSSASLIAQQAVTGAYSDMGQDRPFFPTGPRSGVVPDERLLRSRIVRESESVVDLLWSKPSRLRTCSPSVPLPTTGSSGSGSSSNSNNNREAVENRKDPGSWQYQFRGCEPADGMNWNVVYKMFQDDAKDWGKIGSGNLDCGMKHCAEFTRRVVEHVFPAPMREPLYRHFLEDQIVKIRCAADRELAKLINDTRYEIRMYRPRSATGRSLHSSSPSAGALSTPPLSAAEGGDSDRLSVQECALELYNVRPSLQSSPIKSISSLTLTYCEIFPRVLSVPLFLFANQHLPVTGQS